MDELDKYLEGALLTRENILELVEDYDIFCEYIGVDLEIGVKYSSPLREGDDDPSFVLYYSKYKERELMFKDHATGVYGNVFRFLKLFLDLGKTHHVYKQINSDLKLGLDSIETEPFVPKLKKRVKVVREAVSIEITSKPYSNAFKCYWEAYDISEAMCKLYNVSEVSILHFITKSAHKTILPKSLCIAYEIFGHFKIYQPTGERAFKFRNNYPTGYIEGAVQLTKDKDFVIITKSTKECMFFREHFKWESVASTSENTMISEDFMDKLFMDYEKVFIWLDIDSPGIAAQQKYIDKYPNIIPIIADRYPEHKDVTDIYWASKQEGWIPRSLSYIHSLIHSKLDGKRR